MDTITSTGDSLLVTLQAEPYSIESYLLGIRLGGNVAICNGSRGEDCWATAEVFYLKRIIYLFLTSCANPY